MGNLSVSVITTVYNECQQIERLLDSLARQSRPPNEIIICDGGSSDGTVAMIQSWMTRNRDRQPTVQLLVEPGANISRGRNLAIAAAVCPYIAVTDAGVVLEATWLAELVAPWIELGEKGTDGGASGPSEPLAVAGFFLADTAPTNAGIPTTKPSPSPFLAAMAATVLPLATEIDPKKFLPSSRSVAFTKAAWAAAGGYPEWLDYCEDLLFDFAINAQQPDAPTAFVWAPKATVHFRPRGSLRSFWTQYYRYARGDGKADLWRKRHLIRYLTYVGMLPALLGHAFWGFFARELGWIGLLAGLLFYCWRPWQRLRHLGTGLAPWQWVQAALLVPIIRIVGDIAKMVGYPVGLWWRRQQWERAEIHWRGKLKQRD
jgi:glycosyltransferase involved in cell wall biosynthesis